MDDPVNPPPAPANVSPTYGLFDRKNSQDAIRERREMRRKEETDPVAQIYAQIESLKRNQDNDQKKIADLEEFRRGMNGDENIKVSDNKITWIGRIGNVPPLVTVDYCDGGDPYKADIPMSNIRPA